MPLMSARLGTPPCAGRAPQEVERQMARTAFFGNRAGNRADAARTADEARTDEARTDEARTEDLAAARAPGRAEGRAEERTLEERVAEDRTVPRRMPGDEPDRSVVRTNEPLAPVAPVSP